MLLRRLLAITLVDEVLRLCADCDTATGRYVIEAYGTAFNSTKPSSSWVHMYVNIPFAAVEGYAPSAPNAKTLLLRFRVASIHIFSINLCVLGDGNFTSIEEKVVQIMRHVRP